MTARFTPKPLGYRRPQRRRDAMLAEIERHLRLLFAQFCAIDPADWLGERATDLVRAMGDLDGAVASLQLDYELPGPACITSLIASAPCLGGACA